MILCLVLLFLGVQLSSIVGYEGGFPRNWGFPWEVESAGGPLIAGGKTMASVFFSLDFVDRQNFFSFFYSSLSRKAWSKLQNHHQTEQVCTGI